MVNPMTAWQDKTEWLRHFRLTAFLFLIDHMRCPSTTMVCRRTTCRMGRCILDNNHDGRCDFSKDIHTCRYCLRDMSCSATSFDENHFCQECLHERMERSKPAGPIEWEQIGEYIQLVRKE
jgi:hypothetical protein